MNEMPMPPLSRATMSTGSLLTPGKVGTAGDSQNAAESRSCAKCGNGFEWTPDPAIRRIFGRDLVPDHCDDCDKLIAVAPRDDEQSTANKERARRSRLEAQWLAMAGPYFSNFNVAALPTGIRPHVDRVMAWKDTETRGIGFIGKTNTGKSRVIHALGRKLHMAGAEVFATSGIEFQEKCTSQVHDLGWREYLSKCREAAILILDDADKLRLTDAVEAAYYGMLEHRRKWCLPVLATLNIGGDAIAEMGSANRGGPIATRLRDLCEFIPLKA